MKKDVCKVEKITSMKNVYQKLLEQGYYVTIDDDNSFITVITDNYTVCGDDDLITLIYNNRLREISSHVSCDEEDELYNKVYETFLYYLEHPKRFTSKKLFLNELYLGIGIAFIVVLLVCIIFYC